MNFKNLYLILAIIFFMAGLVNLTFPDRIMFTFRLLPITSNIFITSTHIGAVFIGFATISFLSRISATPQLSTLGRMLLAIFLTIIIFLIIIISGLLSDSIWLVSIIALLLAIGCAYFVIVKRKK